MQNLVNWFDFVPLIMVALGIWLGRRRGMSGELLDMIMWIAIVVVGGFLYKPVGGWIHDVMLLSLGVSNILAYLFLGGTIFVLTLFVRKGSGEKLMSADTFGSMEYYLGMAAGAVRFLCITVALIALLHGPYVSDQQLTAKVERQQEDLGAVYFPPFGQIQRWIFRDSMTGRTAEEHLDFLLVQPQKSTQGKGTNVYQQRMDAVEEVIDGR